MWRGGQPPTLTSTLRATSYNSKHTVGATAVATLDRSSAQELMACDIHAQRALMLLEIPLADAALRSGVVREFDRRSRSLEARARQTLACSPRDSFVWLLLFGLESQHGRLDERTFDLLSMSYETSPHEAWISVRRIIIALPVLLAAPMPFKKKYWPNFRTS